MGPIPPIADLLFLISSTEAAIVNKHMQGNLTPFLQNLLSADSGETLGGNKEIWDSPIGEFEGRCGFGAIPF